MRKLRKRAECDKFCGHFIQNLREKYVDINAEAIRIVQSVCNTVIFVLFLKIYLINIFIDYMHVFTILGKYKLN